MLTTHSLKIKKMPPLKLKHFFMAMLKNSLAMHIQANPSIKRDDYVAPYVKR